MATYQCCYRDFITIIINYILEIEHIYFINHHFCRDYILLGMPLNKIMETIEAGMGSTLGHIALIFGLGAMLGKLLADGGGANRIADTLIAKFGPKHVQWAMLVAAFIVGIALFFEVGLVLLIPLVFTIAKRAKVSPLKLGLPMVTALSVTHGFLPPHPGPVVIAKELKANVGEVLLFGIIIAIPVTIIAGPVFNKIAQKLSLQLTRVKVISQHWVLKKNLKNLKCQVSG